MPRQAGLNSNISGLKVSNLAYHDHIRVLPQNGAQAFREGHIGFQINLCLPNSFHVILNRILDGKNVARSVVQLVKASVQRG